jgi:hypothetical protein
MNEFRFSIDTKQIIWERVNFYIKADSLEDAKKNVSKLIETDGIDGLVDTIWNDGSFLTESELLYETAERMSVEENGGNPTEEIMCLEDNEILVTNVQETK